MGQWSRSVYGSRLIAGSGLNTGGLVDDGVLGRTGMVRVSRVGVVVVMVQCLLTASLALSATASLKTNKFNER